jgi:hypothetical protein
VGGATAGAGIDALLGNPEIGPVETDVYIGSRTAAICDAHDLPFAAESFDALCCKRLWSTSSIRYAS